jgi:hypothetical protein
VIGANFVSLAEQAVKENHSHIRYLEALLAMECERAGSPRDQQPDSRCATAAYEDVGGVRFRAGAADFGRHTHGFTVLPHAGVFEALRRAFHWMPPGVSLSSKSYSSITGIGRSNSASSSATRWHDAAVAPDPILSAGL